MKRRIIVPVNETTRSERAIPIAVAFARRLKASLTLVSVVTWPYTDHPGHPGYHEGLVKTYPDIEVESVVMRTLTDTAGAIESLCRPGDVICIGTDHTSATAEVLLRSVFLDLVRKFHGPVIAVGPKAVMPDTATRCLSASTATRIPSRALRSSLNSSNRPDSNGISPVSAGRCASPRRFRRNSSPG